MPRATWIEIATEIAFFRIKAMPLPLLPASLPDRTQRDAVPYSAEAMRQDLARVRTAWEECQSSRQRDAIHDYLTAVYALVTWWAAEGQDRVRGQHAVRLSGLCVVAREYPFAAVIRCAADPAKADKRTRSKWSRVMRYAVVYKLDSEPLEQFVKRKGGINASVARFSRCLGRDVARAD
jgi:hypothetical protein